MATYLITGVRVEGKDSSFRVVLDIFKHEPVEVERYDFETYDDDDAHMIAAGERAYDLADYLSSPNVRKFYVNTDIRGRKVTLP